MLAHVITISDRCSAGQRVDLSGPAAAAILTTHGCAVTTAVIPDGAESVQEAIGEALRTGARLIVTSGGTGVGPRDRTPEGTLPIIDHQLPGIMEMLRSAPGKPAAYLTRGIAGVVDPGAKSLAGALIVNLPGSPKAVAEGVELVCLVAGHILDQLQGGDH